MCPHLLRRRFWARWGALGVAASAGGCRWSPAGPCGPNGLHERKWSCVAVGGAVSLAQARSWCWPLSPPGGLGRPLVDEGHRPPHSDAGPSGLPRFAARGRQTLRAGVRVPSDAACRQSKLAIKIGPARTRVRATRSGCPRQEELTGGPTDRTTGRRGRLVVSSPWESRFAWAGRPSWPTSPRAGSTPRPSLFEEHLARPEFAHRRPC